MLIEATSNEAMLEKPAGFDTDPNSLSAREQTILTTFYTTVRAGAVRLSDGGGPFGFDITKALLVDVLIEAIEADAFIETGTFLGDTAAYVARAYPHLAVWSCDIVESHATVAQQRLLNMGNAAISHEDSRSMLARAAIKFAAPIIYLDAHWYDDWPLARELALVEAGVVVVDDFDIGERRFAFDSYRGIRCDIDLIEQARPDWTGKVAVPNTKYDWKVPCLQIGRRSGIAVVILDDSLRARLVDSGLLTIPERA